MLPMSPRPSRGALISTLASLASLFAALSCCLPLGALLMAAGSAGASIVADKWRPWLLVLSAGALVFAFVQTYFRRRCEFRNRRLRTVLLWFSAVTVIGMFIAPGYIASLIAGRIPSLSGGELRDFDPLDFVREFDAASDSTRLVVLLSPT
jgi:MFS family permease